jgi:hypothetical protein
MQPRPTSEVGTGFFSEQLASLFKGFGDNTRRRQLERERPLVQRFTPAAAYGAQRETDTNLRARGLLG